MSDQKPFSTVNYLARHEIGMAEILMVENWDKKLTSITKVGGGINKALGIADTTHFVIEQRKVKKWLRGVAR